MALALTGCKTCMGLGLHRGDLCSCVLRAIFRTVMAEYRGHHQDRGPRRRGNYQSYQYPELDYQADVELLGRRHLTAEELRVFEARYLAGLDWQTCCRKLRMDRGLFHHAIYRIEAKMGRAFLETEPFALYPVQSYFGGERKPVRATVVEMPLRQTAQIFRTLTAAAA